VRGGECFLCRGDIVRLVVVAIVSWMNFRSLPLSISFEGEVAQRGSGVTFNYSDGNEDSDVDNMR
jgi:hypothetical protein